MGWFDRFRAKPRRPRGPFHLRAPRRGVHAQGVCVLLERPIARDQLAAALPYGIRRELPAAEGPMGWAMSGPGLVLEPRRGDRGIVVVDIVDQPWPDGMGAPEGPDAHVFAAWALGQFGPCTYPGALERARRHGAPALAEAAGRHGAFLRVRLTYASGRADAPVEPVDVDELDELRQVSAVQLAATQVPGALCAFNPNGELLLTAPELATILERDRTTDVLAVDAWAGVRRFALDEADASSWLRYETVGLGQLGLADQEAIIPADHPSRPHVPGLLLSMAAYDTQRGGVLHPGDTATDLGGVLWRARLATDGYGAPPRPVLRWSPDALELTPALAGRSRRAS